MCFPVNIMKFLRICILKKIYAWLLLKHLEEGTEDGGMDWIYSARKALFRFNQQKI